MTYWLMKSEPSEYSIDDLRRDKCEPWDGIRNYQVRNMMRDQMKKGDQALFYHSNAGDETGVVGVMKIVKEAYPDPTQFDPKSVHPDLKSDPLDPRWLCVDVAFVKKLDKLVSLAAMKKIKAFADMPLVKKGNRLSIMSISQVQFDNIVKLGSK